MDKDEMQVYTVQSHRLDRIEEKLDQMAEAIVALARAEEKITTLTDFNKQQAEQVQNLINRIDRVESLATGNSNTVALINEVFWVIVVGLISAFTWEMVLHSGYFNGG